MRRRGRHRLGAGLPAPAGAGDAARAAPRPADRLLPAHPVPAGRALLASCRGAARSSRGCSAPTWSASSCRVRPPTSSAWCASGSATRPTATRSTCRTDGSCRRAAFPISIDAAGLRGAGPLRGGRGAGRRDPRGARQPAQGLPRHRPARLHQGHLRPAARLRRADRRGRRSTSRTPSSSRSRRRLASASSSTASCATTSTGWSAGSTATSAGSADPAIPYLHSSYPREEMAALYRAADIMVVTPFRDGMNLVAKEYVACRYDDDGALVLSEFAGAADELRQAYLVNPYDINGMKAGDARGLRTPSPRRPPAGCGRCARPSRERRRRLGRRRSSRELERTARAPRQDGARVAPQLTASVRSGRPSRPRLSAGLRRDGAGLVLGDHDRLDLAHAGRAPRRPSRPRSRRPRAAPPRSAVAVEDVDVVGA